MRVIIVLGYASLIDSGGGSAKFIVPNYPDKEENLLH